jgi:hypothetical protein
MAMLNGRCPTALATRVAKLTLPGELVFRWNEAVFAFASAVTTSRRPITVKVSDRELVRRIACRKMNAWMEATFRPAISEYGEVRAVPVCDH